MALLAVKVYFEICHLYQGAAKMRHTIAIECKSMAQTIIPVILAGGSGTRLWPLSRKNFPKQFLRLQSDATLLQQTLARALSLSCSDCLIISNEAHYFLCQEQLNSAGCTLTYLLEPCARNTAPAVAAAAHYIARHFGEDAVMLILPSDHWIGDVASWREAIACGVKAAANNSGIITFGIKPTSAKTGYGYIEAVDTGQSPLKVKSFREKPDVQTAELFIQQGHYFWNSGMFAAKAATWLHQFQLHAKDIYRFCDEAVFHAHHHHDFFRLDLNAFSQCENQSIDYAVMEKTSAAYVIPTTMPWSDLGCWTAVAEANPLDDDGNVLQGNAIAKDSKNCLISSEKTLVTALGIKDQIIVATADAILVADKRYSQQVKDIVSALASKHPQLADEHLRVLRPWGYYEILAEGETFKVKRLMVNPGAKLSLQMHQRRAEHWVVVSGEAEVINGDKLLCLGANQSTYIPQKTRHRLGNPGSHPLYVIEVQSGDYLGEDDIIRFDDIYHREVELP